MRRRMSSVAVQNLVKNFNNGDHYIGTCSTLLLLDIKWKSILLKFKPLMFLLKLLQNFYLWTARGLKSEYCSTSSKASHRHKCETTKYRLSLSYYTNPDPRPKILSGGIVTPASSRNKASANRLWIEKKQKLTLWENTRRKSLIYKETELTAHYKMCQHYLSLLMSSSFRGKYND